MDIGILALGVLIATIFIGFRTGMNMGLLGLSAAFIVGHLVFGVTSAAIISGWPTKLFVTLLGMTLLFSIANTNGTLSLISEKVCSSVKGNVKLLPVIFFAMSAVIAAFGSGPIVATALIAPIAMQLTAEEEIPELLMGTMVISGALAGGLSPITPSGIIANTLAAEQGLCTERAVFLSTMVIMLIVGAAFYVLLGGCRLQNRKISDFRTAERFNTNQKKTLVVLFLVLMGILVLKWDIGLTAFAGATTLLLLKSTNQKQAISAIPMPTLILISGVAVLVNVVNIVGGIDSLSRILSSIMTTRTAAGVLAVTGGLMSLVSSASGVVMPTLIPTVSSIAATTNTSPYALVAGVVVGSHVVTFSPLSTLGALVLASAPEGSKRQRLFTQQMIIGLLLLIFSGLLGILGFYNMF